MLGLLSSFFGGGAKGQLLKPAVDVLVTTSLDGSEVLNEKYGASTAHTFVVEFAVPDGQPNPAQVETFFYYGHATSLFNYLWLRRDTSGNIIVHVAAGGNGQMYLTMNREMFSPGRPNKICVVKDATRLELYINGRRYAKTTGKSLMVYNALYTRVFANSTNGVIGGLAGNYVSRVQYYDKALTPKKAEKASTVSWGDYGIAISRLLNSIGLAGLGQSNMRGTVAIGEKPTMPEVAAGRLKKITPRGNVVDFDESWYDKGLDVPIIPYFAQADDDVDVYGGWIGRAGNDLAEFTENTVVIAPAARGGTGMLPFWTGARTDLNIGAGTTESLGFLTWAAIHQINHLKTICDDVYTLNAQGEYEARNALGKAFHKQHLTDFYKYLDEYFPGMQHFVLGLGQWNASTPSTETNWNDVTAARQEVCAERDNCHFIDVSDVPLTDALNLHYGNAEQEIIGARVANMIFTRFYAEVWADESGNILTDENGNYIAFN